jgi:hypothetical protein
VIAYSPHAVDSNEAPGVGCGSSGHQDNEYVAGSDEGRDDLSSHIGHASE